MDKTLNFYICEHKVYNSCNDGQRDFVHRGDYFRYTGKMR